MKKLLLSGLLVGLTASAFAQGQVNVRNVFNTDTSATATSNGQILLNNGSSTVPIATDFNLTIYGGADVASLVQLFSYSGAAAVGINAAGPGTFFEPDIATVANATATGTFRIDVWLGNLAFNDPLTTSKGSVTFTNPLGNPNASPPGTPAELSNMPALVVSSVPEPGTFALAGLGAAALLIFRRRK